TFTFIALGAGVFPPYLLTQSRCWPSTERDGQQVMFRKEVRTIGFTSSREPNEQAWASHGWSVHHITRT
ncbi:MAG TPA: hypothetical protein VEI97_07470, partial [bacterium]|nr:hypothetical protein [bacterium]